VNIIKSELANGFKKYKLSNYYSWLPDVILKILHLIKTMLFAISFHIVKYITIQKFGARFLFKIN